MQKNIKVLKNIKNLILVAVIGAGVLSLQSCKSEYTQLVETEMSSGIVHDSLIHGLRIGQTKKEFYKHCWALNKSKAITAGSGNEYALFVLPADSTDTHPDKINVQFYGIFDDNDVMHGMEMKMDYYSWAPWLKHFGSEYLIEKVKSNMMKDYPGNDFMELQVGENTAFVKVDGNRQISMFPLSFKQIMVKIEDLRVKDL